VVVSKLASGGASGESAVGAGGAAPQ